MLYIFNFNFLDVCKKHLFHFFFCGVRILIPAVKQSEQIMAGLTGLTSFALIHCNVSMFSLSWERFTQHNPHTHPRLCFPFRLTHNSISPPNAGSNRRRDSLNEQKWWHMTPTGAPTQPIPRSSRCTFSVLMVFSFIIMSCLGLSYVAL